jgi:catechol 2,3-dioxygenase-like lactoylglutathione lyase family enzyme
MFVAGLVNLYTSDIEAGLHFYRDLLGFAETFALRPRALLSTPNSG